MIILIISMPICFAEQISSWSDSITVHDKAVEEYQEQYKEKYSSSEEIIIVNSDADSFTEITAQVIEGFEEETGVDFNENDPYDSSGNSITGYITVQQTPADYKEKCMENHEQTSKLVDMMDNELISMLEKVFSMMYLLCTVFTTIDSILSTFKAIIGSAESCLYPWLESLCVATDGTTFAFWTTFRNTIQPVCCFITCGWCTGQKCGGILSSLDDLYGGSSTQSVVKGLKIGPYDNIYTAIGCLCPGAVLFNIRKLKTIFQVYDCCIEQACENGLDPEVCEKQLSYSTCMYWEGSLMMTLANALSSLLAKMIAELITKTLVQFMGKSASKRVLAIYELTEIPGRIQGIIDAMDWLDKSFDDPSCDDLGFAELKAADEAKKVTVTCTNEGTASENCTASRPSESYTVSDDGTKFINQGFMNTKNSVQDKPSEEDKKTRIEDQQKSLLNNKKDEKGNPLTTGETLKGQEKVDYYKLEMQKQDLQKTTYQNRITEIDARLNEKTGIIYGTAPTKEEVDKLKAEKIELEGKIKTENTAEKDYTTAKTEQINNWKTNARDNKRQKDLITAQDKVNTAEDKLNSAKPEDKAAAQDEYNKAKAEYAKASKPPEGVDPGLQKQIDMAYKNGDASSATNADLINNRLSNTQNPPSQADQDSMKKQLADYNRASMETDSDKQLAYQKRANLEGDIRNAKDGKVKTDINGEEQEMTVEQAEALKDSLGKDIDSQDDDVMTKAEQDALEQQMSDAVAKMLTKLLNEYAYNYISDYCKDQWESSDVESMKT